MIVTADKIGSATSPLALSNLVSGTAERKPAEPGDVVAVRALTESITYGNLELPTGRLAKINRGDILLGVLGRRRALKGFVGDVPDTVASGDRLHVLNLGGVIGQCTGHHSSLSEAIEVEVLSTVTDENGKVCNLSSAAITVDEGAVGDIPVIMIAGSCMNSGKTVAASELVKQASHRGLRVAAGKLSGIACLRDTLNMADHGALVTASFLDCGLPSTAGIADLAPVAKTILSYLSVSQPDLIVLELGDGIIGGYGVESVLRDTEFMANVDSLVFCASDYVGVVGAISIFDALGLSIDVVAGSVTDSQMGEDFIVQHYGLAAGNARRDGERLFDLAAEKFREKLMLRTAIAGGVQ